MASTKSGTLTANTISSVTLPEPTQKGAGVPHSVEVMNRTGSAEIWFTIGLDGDTPADPVANADGAFCVPASVCSYEVEYPSGWQSQATVKLLSTGAQAFCAIGD